MSNPNPTVNVNVNTASQPFTPMNAPQPAPAAPSAAPSYALKTKRSLLKYILLGLITFGIYDLWQMSEVSTSINLIATKRDGRKTMHYLLMFFLVGWLTLGIGWFVWGHNLSDRVGNELAARRIGYSFGAADFWLWNILGSLIIVGPFIYTHKLLTAMNMLSADYNQRG